MYISTKNITRGIDGVRVINMTKPQTGCLHDYQLTPQDLKTLEAADAFIVNGAGMESFLDKVVSQGIPGIPWLVADGYVANYRDVLDNLPLILVTSNWVKEVYIRDGIRSEHIEILPVGCDTETFYPRNITDPKVAEVREILGVAPDELFLLTVGGDAASKGAQEVMQALARINDRVPKWKYICKVWPQKRTDVQNVSDHQLAEKLGIADKIVYTTGKVSRTFMPYLIAACDIYVGPSRLEGFGMPHIEAGASGKPVIAINAMAFKDTIVHGETGFLAGVAKTNVITETILGESAGFNEGHRIVFDPPRVADYRASVEDIADALLTLMNDTALRQSMGEAARARIVEHYDYRVVAKDFLEITARYGQALYENQQNESMRLA
jgi:glycosyltransferase involved in cell wall biosynthesis